MGERYGIDQYGDLKYGVSGNQNLLWAIEIDWDDDSVFDGTNEALRCIDLTTQRGREVYIKPGGGQKGRESGFEQFRPGRATIRLRNDDGRFDAFNTSSPIFGDIEPGRFIRIKVTDGLTSTEYDVFAGKIDKIAPSRKKGFEYVDVTCSDGWRLLFDEEPAIVIQADVATEDAIDQILTDIDWPSIWGRDLLAAANTLDNWWEDGRKAAKAISELVDNELGRFFIAADGKAKFRGRHNIDSSVITITEDLLLKPIEMPQPQEVIKNRVEVVVHPRITQADVEIWRMQDKLFIEAGVSKNVWAGFRFDGRSVPANNLTTPAPTTDYTANTQEGGGGSDLTTDFTVAIASTFSKTAKLSITNGSTDDGYVTLLKMHGDAIDSPDATVIIDDRSGLDQPRIFVLDSDWKQSIQDAINAATFLSDMLNAVREFPSGWIQGRPATQFGFDIGDRISIDIDAKSIDSDYRVGYIEHSWLTSNGQSVLTRFKVEPFADFDNFWQFTTTVGVKSVFAY